MPTRAAAVHPYRHRGIDSLTRASSDFSIAQKRVIATSSLLLICVPVLALLGWILNSHVLKSLSPGFVAMNPATAVSFLLSGVALWLALHHGKLTPPGRVMAGLVLMIAAIRILDYLGLTGLSIDTILFHSKLAQESIPNRMAPNTAVCLLLAAVALLTNDFKTGAGRQPAQYFALLIGVGALITLTGYGLRASNLAQIGEHIPMALHTGFLFGVLSIAILATKPDGSFMHVLSNRGPSGKLARRLFLAAALVPFVLVYVQTAGIQAGLLDSGTGMALFVVSDVLLISAIVWMSCRSLAAREATERVMRDDAVRQAQEIQDLYNHAPCGYHSLDRSGKIIQMNDTELAWLGYGREEIIGKLTIFDIVSDQSRDAVAMRFGKFLEQGIVHDLELELKRKDGSLLPVLLNSTALRDADGRFIQSRSSVFDLRERRRIEAEANLARFEAERANQAKSEFLSRMSHELRTPMNAILGFTQLLEMDETDERRREHIDHIFSGGKHLLSLINEVLDLSKIEAGRLEVSCQPVQIGPVVAETVGLVTPLANLQGIRLHTELDGHDGDFVDADRQRLVQVLLNLLSNAVKYNRQKGTVTVRCQSGGSGRIQIMIEDTGVGIRPDEIADVFTPFKRLGESQSIEGTGLGLPLSKGLVESMGGTLRVDSVAGEGTIFLVELRKSKSQARSGSGPTAPPEHFSDIPSGSWNVLQIEDNHANVNLMREVMGLRQDIELSVAMDGRQALHLAQSRIPDLVLLDVHLPDISGLDLYRRLRGLPDFARVPVVVVSADATEIQIRRFLKEGAYAYLTKPLDLRELMRVVDRCLIESSVGRQAA